MKARRPIYRKKKPVLPKFSFEPRAGRQLAATLRQIGVPAAQPFVPDPFQLEALSKLAGSDVLVSAPTGSGKTWIAQKAIEHCLQTGQHVWYASPLKALSNAKLVEFSKIFGTDNVGILTGDRKENSTAPLIVGTTEILRNQLYDAMHQGRDLPIGLVILDEAHYLGDEDRGVVWEETLIYMPPRIRLLLLSATIANSGQIAGWLEHIRGTACQVVYSGIRPVPLAPLFLFPDGLLTPLQSRKGGLLPAIRSFISAQRPSHPSISNAVNALQVFNLLPAIFFLKSRADCEKALLMAAQARLDIDSASREQLRQVVNEFLTRFPFLARQDGLDCLINNHLAVHHAGLLPHWKLLVEELMRQGLLKAIFSTSTVAAGVNFPARTVVISQSDRFDGQEFSNISAADLTQMTGRAGRRGMDKIGFALLLPGPFQNLNYMADLFNAQPEPVKSQLNINFSMVLNLLLSHRPQDIRQLLELSLAAWQADKAGRPEKKTKNRQLAALLEGANCATAAEVVVRGDRLRLLRQRLQAINALRQEEPSTLGRWQALTRGRVFVSMRMLPFAVLNRDDNQHNPGVWAVGLLPEKRLRRGYPRVEFVAQDDIYKIYADIISLPGEDSGRGLARAISGFDLAGKKELSGQQIKRLGVKGLQALNERERLIRQSLETIPCHNCFQQSACENSFSEITIQAAKLGTGQQTAANRLWYEFIRHLEFLRSEAYVTEAGRLTRDGFWASSLRLGQPLLIAEAIRHNALPTHQPALLAALLAQLADNRDTRDNSNIDKISPAVRQACQKLGQVLQPLLQRLHEWGFAVPPLPLPAAGAIYAWGEMADLGQVSELYGAGEGDVAQLIFRVADNLRQLMNLSASHPALAKAARQAAELLIRPPILLPI